MAFWAHGDGPGDEKNEAGGAAEGQAGRTRDLDAVWFPGSDTTVRLRQPVMAGNDSGPVWRKRLACAGAIGQTVAVFVTAAH